MPDPIRPGSDPTLRSLRGPLALTRLGMAAEALWRAFWPLISVLMAAAALLMLGLQDMVAPELAWAVLGLAGLAALVFAGLGLRRLRWPDAASARARLDATLPGRPIQALLDEQAIGGDDPASAAVWQVHQDRMAARAAQARPVAPDLRIARRDPFALRYVAALVFSVAVLFGSVWRVGSVAEIAPGSASAMAAGPSWEGWIEPPRYTGKPTLYLNDQTGAVLTLPEGSRITTRFYGEVGALSLTETLSGQQPADADQASPNRSFDVVQSGMLAIDGPGGRSWDVALIEDEAPQVAVTGEAGARATGEMTLPFAASDDYAVVAGQARIDLDRDALDRRYGLAADPDPREAVTVQLPMPIAGDRSDFTETLIEDFSKHPWANLPVIFTLSAVDAAEQEGQAPPFHTRLPARRFFDPMAAAVMEQRRDLLWARSNGARVAQILRAISHRPEDVFRSQTAYLRMRVVLRRLETFVTYGIKATQQDEIAEALWDLAILLEEGDLGDALERLRRAQERLTEAMKNGASDAEIADLMQELRDATDDYLRQLSRQAQQQGDPQDGQQGETMQMTQDDLQRMMDRIQDLMEQGRMAEAQQALEELQQMMENMRVTQGQGQNGQSEGQRAMEGLADTLRDQQGLSDQAFRDLQEQFNPNAQQGENRGNQGRDGGLGQGEQHQQPGQGQGQNGQGNEQAGNDGQPGEGNMEGSLADRQQALRDELGRQQQNLPGAGTPEGDDARDALGRAGNAMDGAEEALRQDDYATAIDRQSEAMEALREGMRALGEALAQNQENQQGQGDAEGDMRGARNRDPLGRNTGSQGSVGTEENLLQGEDVYRRARELLDEIRRRSGDSERPEIELDYLRRLLERF